MTGGGKSSSSAIDWTRPYRVDSFMDNCSVQQDRGMPLLFQPHGRGLRVPPSSLHSPPAAARSSDRCDHCHRLLAISPLTTARWFLCARLTKFVLGVALVFGVTSCRRSLTSVHNTSCTLSNDRENQSSMEPQISINPKLLCEAILDPLLVLARVQSHLFAFRSAMIARRLAATTSSSPSLSSSGMGSIKPI
jgi:hypothetical protein